MIFFTERFTKLKKENVIATSKRN